MMLRLRLWLVISALIVTIVCAMPSTTFHLTEAQEIYRISFWMTANHFNKVFSVNSDGSDVVSVPVGINDESCCGRWSPDGRKLAYVQIRNHYTRLVVLDIESGFQRILTPSTAIYIGNPPNFDWSPDSKRIAFVSSGTDYTFAIYVINADGTGEIKLTNPPRGDSYPRWSPDGTQIVFNSERSGTYQIYIMNKDGSNQTQLTNSDRNNYYPEWSPDGASIYFSSDRDKNLEIYRISREGKNETNITHSPAYEARIAFSPDGNKIAFVSDRDGGYQVFIADKDGNRGAKLTNTLNYMDEPAWSPDGNALAVTDNEQIYIISADGQLIRKLVNTHDMNWPMFYPQWQPKRSN